ncbi:SusC/RagA family TonB-linked outer membrane protein [Yeosuana aromativorans]|uniref:SusC/RagA family TonB-linked outer membrane protein n=1 Tax=Yeosuana aromativorans TaxID=288019 RepID=A0A8J3BIH6_9FLAO|nr:SusC/RagA family TonB-linked outer membrane protein [Yeosuana aromativorans]GGK23918.1 SusC/RagA family TonB-linked outer membrane protein [Yeosuana aromativorans]
MIQKVLKLLFVFCLFAFQNAKAQTTVTGTITDAATGIPLPGASIVVKGTTNGVSSDFDGNYSIDVSTATATFVVSYVGYATKEVAFTGTTPLNISLSEDAEQLNEVVVTALGISREKKSLGYAVSTIEGSSVSLAKETNVVSSLAGKVAGVVVSRSTSGAGGGTRVVIRGNGSLTGNNQPLYVVDGIPIDNSGVSNAGAGEYSVRDLGTGVSDINSDDIESMSILKGPNAAALYGSRAANGVVLITTKKGKLNQGLGVSINSSAVFDSPLVLPDYQNQYGRGTDGDFPNIVPSDPLSTQVTAVTNTASWGPKFDGSSHLEFNGQMRPYSAQPNNVKDFFETGASFVNTISISNSTDKSSVFFSYTNSDIQSILPNSGLKRNNFNLRGFTKLSDKLSFDAKVTYFLQSAKNRPEQGTEGLAAYLWGLPRNVSLSDLKVYQNIENPIDPNNPYKVISPRTGTGNPYWILYNDSNEDQRTRITGFAKATYEFTDWLSAFIRVGRDAVSQDTKQIHAIGHHFYPGGDIRFGQNDITETNYDFLLMFNKDLNDKFNLSLNAGGNMLHSTRISSGSFGKDFKIPGKYFLDNADGNTIVATQSDLIEKKVNSVYGQGSLSYMDMVYLDLTARNDWSSALAAENRSYFYSSASLSFLLHKLFNLQGTKIDFLKLRASTANVGNDTEPQQIVNLFTVAADGYLGVTQVNRPTIKFSESLKPEDIRSTEVGLEARAFKNRLYADFSYYSITTKDLIFDVPVDPGTGYSYFRENIGKLTNKGFELMIGGKPIQNENFSWDVSANISKNDNKLESLIAGQDNFTFSTTNGGIVDVRAQVGGGYGDIYTTTWLRNDQGQLIVTDEGRPQATSERQKFGNYQPDYTGGITNTFNYKNFTLNFLIDFRIGGDVYSGTDAALDASGVSKRSLQYREGGVVVQGVHSDGTPNTTSISAQDYWGAVSGIGSEYVYDQSNARLRELSLTYRFAKKLLEKTFVQNASVSLTGRNLFFLWKKTDNFDPESSYSTNNFSQGVLFYALPTTKSVGLSLNVKF